MWTIDTALAKGRDLPPWVHDEPELYRGDDFFLSAFFDLGTCRSLTEGGAGPIPWTAIVDYADRAGLVPDVAAGFVRVIRSMDSVYLEWFGKKQKKMVDEQMKNSKSKAK